MGLLLGMGFGEVLLCVGPPWGCSMWRLCSLSQGNADREDPCCGGGGELEI